MALSNFGDMIDQVVRKINLSGVVDPSLYQKARNGINAYYSLVHSLWPIPAALRSDTFTWTSGQSFDVLNASGVTGWRGMPLRVSGAGDDNDWLEVDLREIYDRRSNAGTGANFASEAGRTRRVFASDMTYLYVVDAISSTSITVVHYQDPPTLSAKTDVPLLPSDLYLLPVYGAVKEILAAANNEQRKKWAQVQPMRTELEAEEIFNTLWERVKNRSSRNPEVKEVADLGPLGERARAMKDWRRGKTPQFYNWRYPRW